MASSKKFFDARTVAYFAVLLALVVVFQTCGGFIQIAGLSLSFVLVPIVLGGVLLGWAAGGLLGFAFGFIVLMYGVAGAESFTAALLADSPVMTVVICLVKGVAAGIVPALLYRLIAKKNRLAAIFAASLAAPVVNTGLFIVGCLIISGTIAKVAGTSTMSETVYFLFIGCAGVNFLIEFAINLVLAPAVYRVVLVAERAFAAKKTASAEKKGLGLLEVLVTASMLLAAALCALTAVLEFVAAPSLWWLGVVLLLAGAALVAMYVVLWRAVVRPKGRKGKS